MSFTEYEKHLREAVAVSGRSKWIRLATMPHLTLIPILTKWMSNTRPAKARTFFGETMNVVLPEAVSTKIWRYGYFEKDVTFFLLSELKEGETFVDVGAHFGFYSILAAKLVGEQGRTISFEPMPETRKILTENLRVHIASGRSTIVPMAAGREAGELVFKDFGIVGSAFATFSDPRGEGLVLQKSVTVQVDTLDNVFAERSLTQCALIKIDAENAEEDVIAGASGVLGKIRPALIVELGDYSIQDKKNSRSRSVIEMLEKNYDYQTFEFNNWSLRPHKKQSEYGYGNFLFKQK